MPYRTLCVLLVVGSIVSFRSVPRIMQVFQPWLWAPLRIPHFTSVIHWTLRAGIALFEQVSTLSEPWVAILDCSIDIGTRKALVVLRVALSALERKQGAIGPRDCECIGLEVSHQWNGLRVSEALTRIFAKTGTMAHVNALSGYARRRDGSWVAFSILVNNSNQSSAAVRGVMDKICILIWK